MSTERRLVWTAAILLVVWLFVYVVSAQWNTNTAPQQTTPVVHTVIPTQTLSPNIDLADASYMVDGVKIHLVDGEAMSDIDNTVSSGPTLRLYQSTYGDLNGDGTTDAAVTLISEPGGSGTFTYVAAVLANGDTTPAVLLGDRIETESIAIKDGVITVSYLDRGPNDPMSTAPTIQKTASYTLVDGKLQGTK